MFMEQNLANLINWVNVHKISSAESSCPHRTLGRHIFKNKDILQAYFPGARKVTASFKGKEPIELTCLDEQRSWFVVQLDSSYKDRYYFTITYQDWNTVTCYDPYSFEPVLSKESLKNLEVKS